MSRIRSVVGTSIMVNLRDVVPGDILYYSGTEQDRIVEKVETREDGKIMLHYKKLPDRRPDNSIWMNPDGSSHGNGCIFVHDLKGERFDLTHRSNHNDQ